MANVGFIGLGIMGTATAGPPVGGAAGDRSAIVRALEKRANLEIGCSPAGR